MTTMTFDARNCSSSLAWELNKASTACNFGHSLLHLYLIHPAGLALLYERVGKLMKTLSGHSIDPGPHLTFMQHSFCLTC